MPPFTGEITVKRIVQTGAVLAATPVLTLAGASVATAAPAPSAASAAVSSSGAITPMHASAFGELMAVWMPF